MQPPETTAKVMVIEDDPALLKLATILLENAGHSVRPFNDPQVALSWLDDPANEIDVALADMMMPGMNGIEFCRRLATMRPSVRRVVMSGYGADDLQELGDDVLFLEKPFTDQTIAAKIDEALRSER